MRVLSVVLTVSLIVPLTTLSAQQPLPVEAGQRLRVTAPSCGLAEYVSELEALVGDTLVLLQDPIRSSNTFVCPIGSLTRLEVSRQQKSHTSAGLIVGGLTLGGAGVVVGGLYLVGEGGSSTGGLIGATVGGVLGALVGSSIKTDRWEEVPLDRLRVSFAPQRDSISFGVSLKL